MGYENQRCRKALLELCLLNFAMKNQKVEILLPSSGAGSGFFSPCLTFYPERLFTLRGSGGIWTSQLPKPWKMAGKGWAFQHRMISVTQI